MQDEESRAFKILNSRRSTEAVITKYYNTERTRLIGQKLRLPEKFSTRKTKQIEHSFSGQKEKADLLSLNLRQKGKGVRKTRQRECYLVLF